MPALHEGPDRPTLWTSLAFPPDSRGAELVNRVVLSDLSGLPAGCQTALPPGSLARPLARVVLHPRPSARPPAVGLAEGGLTSRQIAVGHVVLPDQGAVEDLPVPVPGGDKCPEVEWAAAARPDLDEPLAVLPQTPFRQRRRQFRVAGAAGLDGRHHLGRACLELRRLRLGDGRPHPGEPSGGGLVGRGSGAVAFRSRRRRNRRRGHPHQILDTRGGAVDLLLRERHVDRHRKAAGHQRRQRREPERSGRQVYVRARHGVVPLVNMRASTASGTFRKLIASTGAGKIPSRFLPRSVRSTRPSPRLRRSSPSSDSYWKTRRFSSVSRSTPLDSACTATDSSSRSIASMLTSPPSSESVRTRATSPSGVVYWTLARYRTFPARRATFEPDSRTKRARSTPWPSRRVRKGAGRPSRAASSQPRPCPPYWV